MQKAIDRVSSAADTTTVNKTIDELSRRQTLWLFGYGSLIFKTGFPWLERRPASIAGWERRFWQGSHDHRGTPASPGRVVTLVPRQGSVCRGVAYRIRTRLLEDLDMREKNGYLRFVSTLTLDDGNCVKGLAYVATPENSAFLGPAPEPEIARHVAEARGESGRNADYVIELATALRKLAAHDPHVFAVERYLLQLGR